MQEAFRRAARQEPRNPVSRKIFSSSDQLRREREIQRLQIAFFQIGEEWLLEKIDGYRTQRRGITKTNVKRRWNGAFEGFLKRDLDEQIFLFGEFARGLQLSEEDSHYAYRSTIKELSLIDRARNLIVRTRTYLSPVSKIFFQIFCDLQNYKDQDKVNLEAYLLKDSFFRGKITLNQMHQGIVRWLKSKVS